MTVPPISAIASHVPPLLASSDADSEESGDDRSRRTGGAVNDRPILTPHEGGEDRYTVDDLMHEVFDLMRRRLPRIDPDDPDRIRVLETLPVMCRALGRDRLVAVPESRTQAS